MCIENNVHHTLQGLSQHLQKADDEVLFHVSSLCPLLHSIIPASIWYSTSEQ
jgi:hypothetical protein